MKPKLKLVLGMEAAVCILLSIVWPRVSGSFVGAASFPFAQIAEVLRILSLSGAVGNAVAFIIYLGLCLLPVAYLIYRGKKSKLRMEDGLLALLSLLLPAVLYLMINPQLMGPQLSSFTDMEGYKASMSVTVYSVIVGYLGFRLVRVIAAGQKRRVLAYMKGLLAVICMFLVFQVCGAGLINFIARLNEVAASKGLVMLQFIAAALPSVMNLFVLFAGLDLIAAMEKDPYGKWVVQTASKMGKLSRLSVCVILLSQIGSNVAQLWMQPAAQWSWYSLTIPLVSTVIALGAAILAEYVEGVRRLKDDTAT